MKLRMWLEQDSGMDQKKQSKRCACFSLQEMKLWLACVTVVFVFTALLIRFKLSEGSFMQKYMGIGSSQGQPLAKLLNNASLSALHVDVEDKTHVVEPPKSIEAAKEPKVIKLGLSVVKKSSLESSTLSVWKYLVPVLSRSDCFPEAKQAMKEAENQWKRFASERKAGKGPQSMNKTTEKQCPYSVNSANQSDAGYTSSGLEIPCGLVVDSAITIVAMPWGAEGNFAIELLGPALPGELDPPIVLHFNVRIQGDQVTDDAVIVQNTWTRDHDWGDEERCPDSALVSKKVDGLDACIEQIGKASVRKLAQNSTDKTQPSLHGIGGKDQWFPFINGLPFAATLWAGWEGFHMTVNGKHITSFEYRENLKPSLVGSVRLKGSVKPISVLATGLPASEGVTNADLKFLKAPPLKKKQRNALFIGVFSTANNFDRRMAVRRSWMQYDNVRSGNVTVRFFVGQHTNAQVNKEIWREAMTYGDIQLMPFVDLYNLITIKTIAICIFGTEIMRSRYVMKTDDDTFVRVDEVLSILDRTEQKKGLMYGLIEFESEPHREPDDKWFVSTEEWPDPSYPPWPHGPGYIISKDIASFVVQGHFNTRLKLFKLEDVSMGMWVQEYKNQNHEVIYKSDENFNNVGCNDGYVIAHYQNPKHMACLWGKLKEGVGPICCNDP